MKRLLGFSLVMIMLGCSSAPKVVVPPAPTQPALPTTIEEAVASPYRTESNRARDQYRHPVETLNFFGLKPSMTVIEVAPATGWYLEILAPLLATRGQYIAAVSPDEVHSTDSKVALWKRAHPEVGNKIMTVEFSKANLELAPEGSADMVLTFRNVHNWMKFGSQDAVFQAFFKVLKPGGILGVVEHRAGKKTKHDKKAGQGYVSEKDLIAIAKKAGFKLDQKSEINANPKDTANYPKGVWTLPPTLALGDQDREKYLTIGESDRMTLRFVKPLEK